MVVGDRTRFWIPGNLAYGDHPTRPGAPAGSLVFDIQLLAIK
jgi:peptidylprolyl isomerase